ncbi:MAG: hypothetical protein KatS3mg115_2612 [Candidatus Poribacteria bacterium]|nr:MAG: hypothetical protein KatS3mg115_2612 [Candidatus Poribacteria bacterium]
MGEYGRMVARKEGLSPQVAVRDVLVHPSLDLALVFARNLGFDGVELSVGGPRLREHPIWSRQGVSALAAERERTRIRFLSVRLESRRVRGLLAEDPTLREATQKLIAGLISRAAALRADVVTLPLPLPDDLKEDQQKELIVYFRDLGDLAARYGPRVALSFSRRWEPGLQVLDAVSSPALGAELDVVAAARARRPVEQLAEELGPRLVQVRMRDLNAEGEICSLGSGVVNLIPLFETLYRRAFQGYCIVDAPPGPDPVATAAANLAHVRELIQTAYQMLEGPESPEE